MTDSAAASAAPDLTAPSPFVLPPAPAELLLETERLVLRPLDEGDLEAAAVYRGDPEVCRFLPFTPQTADDIRSRIGHILGSTSLEGDRGVPVAIVRREDGELIGDLVLFHLDAVNGSVEIGWVLRPDAAGHGYATEACHALLDAAFRIYGVRRIVARIAAENTASARLAERLGMRLEARLVENEWFKGQWGDELDYAILAREWQSPAT
jgi:RimJ/RimL family protein N-acetyltransferase